MAILNLYFTVYMLLSGYLLPLPWLPGPIATLAAWLPFRFMLSLPVELMTREFPRGELAELMAAQLGWAIATVATALWIWNRGVRRFESVGG